MYIGTIQPTWQQRTRTFAGNVSARAVGDNQEGQKSKRQNSEHDRGVMVNHIICRMNFNCILTSFSNSALYSTYYRYIEVFIH